MFSELPQWIDMGPDQDFAGPASDLATMLKKRFGKKTEGGAGGAIAGELNPAGVETPNVPLKIGQGVKSL